jgi:hypothetical protein
VKQSPEAQKADVLHELIEARCGIMDALESLPLIERDTPFLGEWSAHYLLAHLIGWDYANRDAAQAVLEGRLPEFYAHYDADWRTYNAGLVRQHKQGTVNETVEAARSSHEALIAFITAISPEDVTRDHGVRSPRGRRVTIAMLLEAEARDEHKHAQQIRDFAAGLSAR